MMITFAFVLLKLVGLLAFLGFAVYLFLRILLRVDHTLEFMIAGIVLFSVMMVLLVSILGGLGYLFYHNLLMASIALFLIVVMISINQIMAGVGMQVQVFGEREKPNYTWVLYPVILALTGTALAVGICRPPMEHDVMTYHLFLPARWIQDAAITTIPSVFGDLAPAYAPKNGEAIFAFIGSIADYDLFARVGQFPYLLLAAFAVFGIGRLKGLSRRASLIPAVIACLSPTVFRQGFTAEVDLMTGAFFVSAVYFLLLFRERPSFFSVLMFSASFGLAIGTKFVAVTICMFLLPPVVYYFVRFARKSPGFAMLYLGVGSLTAIASGGFWYIRNWIITGNPLFPLHMPPFFNGIYSRTAMNTSEFHGPLGQFFLPVWSYAYGPIISAVALLSLGIAIWLIVRKKVSGIFIYVYALPWMLVLAHFFIVPYNTQYRFLIPAVLLTFLPLGDMDEEKKYRWSARIAWGLPTIISIVGPGISFNLLGIPVSGQGLVPRHYLLTLLATLLATFIFYMALVRIRLNLIPRIFVVMFAVAFSMVLFFVARAQVGCEQIVFIRGNGSGYPLRAWDWVQKSIKGDTIAYSGNNVPYYLLGRFWQNKVVYVNIEGPQHWKIYDHWKHCEETRDCPDPDATDKPVSLYRDGNKLQWLSNLNKAGASYLFVAPMGGGELRTIRSDAEGYPVERSWAQSMPSFFKIVFQSKGAEIYRIYLGELSDAVAKGMINDAS